MKNVFKFIGIIAVAIVVIIGVRMCGVPIVDLRTDDPVVTLVKFDQIRKGMTYEQIVEIVGEEGVVFSDSSIEDDLDGEIKTIVFEWKNGDFSGMKVTIKDGKLFEKSQSELE